MTVDQLTTRCSIVMLILGLAMTVYGFRVAEARFPEAWRQYQALVGDVQTP